MAALSIQNIKVIRSGKIRSDEWWSMRWWIVLQLHRSYGIVDTRPYPLHPPPTNFNWHSAIYTDQSDRQTVEEKRTQWSNNLIDYIEAYNKNIPSNQLVGQFRCKLKHTNTIRANVIRKGETHTCNEAKIWRDNNDTYGAPTPSHSSLCQVSLFNWAIKLVMCLRVFVIVCASVRMWFFSSSSIISESDENRW